VTTDIQSVSHCACKLICNTFPLKGFYKLQLQQQTNPDKRQKWKEKRTKWGIKEN